MNELMNAMPPLPLAPSRPPHLQASHLVRPLLCTLHRGHQLVHHQAIRA